MRTASTHSRQAAIRLIAFAAVLGLALIVNARWHANAAPQAFLPLPGQVFPNAAAGLYLTALEPPDALGRQELWASYQAPSPPQSAYASLSYGTQSFHSWIGCFLIEGPQPLWSGTVSVPTLQGPAQFAADVLRQGGHVRAVAHSECWQGRWRGSEWQTRWFALWRTPGERVPLLNAYIVTDAGHTQTPALRAQLTAFLSALDWQQLNATCASAR